MFDSGAVLPIFAVLLYLTMLVVVVARRRFSRPEHRLLDGYLLAVIAWTLTFLLPPYLQAGNLERLLSACCMVLMPALFLGIVLSALHRKYRWWWLLPCVLALACVLVLEGAYALAPQGIPLPQVHVQPLLVMALWALPVLASVALILDAYIRAGRPAQRVQLSYLIVAVLLTALADGLYFAQSFRGGLLVLFLKVLGTVALTCYFVAEYLPDWRYVIRRTAKCLLLMLLSFLVISVCVLGAQILVQPGTHGVWTGMAVAAVVLGVAYMPAYGAVVRLGSRLRFGRSTVPACRMRDYSQSIANILSAEELAAVSIRTIDAALEIASGALLIAGRGADGALRLRSIPVRGTAPCCDGMISQDSPLIEFFCNRHTPFTCDDLARLHAPCDLPAEERRWLGELDAHLFVPAAMRAGNPAGFFALGPKRSGAPFQPEDLELLTTLAAQTGVALENVRLVEDLRRLNDEISALNAELQRTNRALTHRDKTKFDFIQIASHELKTPLTLVRGYADMLSSMGTDELMNTEFIEEATTGIVSNTSRMAEMIDAMLDVARLDADALALQLSMVSLGHIVECAIGDLAPAIAQRNLHISAAGFQTLPPIRADGQRLHQALVQVLSNAVKFTPDGGDILVSGELLRSQQSMPFVQIVVRDTGIGINPEERELIFETFYRTDDPALHSTGKTKFKGGGPGLGLTIVKGIIESHRGRVWVESKYHSEQDLPGTSFFILLPLDPEQSRGTQDRGLRPPPSAALQ